jgi:hypothetical protein
MAHICIRSALSGVSCGISAYGVEIRDAVEAREFRVWTEPLCETTPEARVDLAVETLAGILIYAMFQSVVVVVFANYQCTFVLLLPRTDVC